jgi:hypothetical protein
LKHRVDSLVEFYSVGLVDATGVDPDVPVAILFGLFAASPNLDRPRLGFLEFALLDITERYFFVILPPSM